MQVQDNDFSELEELTEENMDFSALSDGLGFHSPRKKAPAIIEKPVAPTSTAPTGATLAGPVRTAPAITAKVEKALWLQPAAARALRFGAFATDIFFVTAPLALACKFSFSREQFFSLLHSDGRIFATLYLSMIAVYFLLSESFGGQSLGKILFDLHIVEDDKYEKPIGFWIAFARLPALLAGIVFFGLGLFSSLADTKARSWHDKITGSIVRRRI